MRGGERLSFPAATPLRRKSTKQHGIYQCQCDNRGIELEETDLNKVDALWLHGPDCLRATMQERLSHRRLVCALDPAWPQVEGIYK